MSDDEWVKRGKLHAVGRYQFIGPTLRGLVQRLNIPLNAKFSPELQDRLFLSLLKSGGPGQWVGLRNATIQELAIIRQAQSKL
jgi:muramidase (phage lysozyme)